ncbi:RNA polymerase sigma factor [Paraliomyxa miuraensis]|nr:RNA polymerase sigma factor [Paraliomyxa miuraensis]
MPTSPGRAEDAAMRDKLARIVARACPAWASSHRDDITQAAMMRMIRAQQQRPNDGLPASYLWKVAYSATIDELRRLRAQREVPMDDEHDGDRVVDPAQTPEDRLRAEHVARSVRECLSALAEARRQAVTLHLAGHSVPESGRILGWNAKRAENLVYRGLADLRKCLTSKGIEP